MDMNNALESVVGLKPYPYQIQVAETLLSGQNVILRAPTGAGKTEAALGPFLLARQQKRTDFPLRCIIASPMRTLAKDLFDRAQKVAGPLGLSVKLHTGEDPQDPELLADIIITTYDQLLSHYLHVPYSQSWGKRNIGAGGVIASYVVLDEFHLFDPQRAFRTTLAMAKALQGITPFVFMTATFSAELTAKLEAEVGAKFITPAETELENMQSQDKRRTFRRVDGLLTAEAVAEAHQGRSIAIANTVDRVQAIYAGLQQLKRDGHPKLRDTELVMLHSRYFPTHRNSQETELKELLGKSKHKDVILVASQAVEVGIDISSDHLHTEICPANSLLQRAGRNARYQGEVGLVSVYALPENDKGEWDELPYKGQLAAIKATWEGLAALPAQITAEAETKLIDAVHTAADLENWRGYEGTRSKHNEKIIDTMKFDQDFRTDLIRDIQNVSLLLVPEKTDLSTWDEINRHERIGVTWVNFAALEANRQKLGVEDGSEAHWLAKVPREVESDRKKGAADDIWQIPKMEWVNVTSEVQLKNETLVLVNPEFVFYNRAEGFRWEAPEGGELGIQKDDFPPISPDKNSVNRPDYWYVYETYEEHITQVLDASNRVAADIWHLCPKVDRKFGLPAGTTQIALKAAIAGHDIGKLSVGWQDWSRRWQARQVARYPDMLWQGEQGKRRVTAQRKKDFSAHTDSWKKYDKELDREITGRPPHAGESAALVALATEEYFMDLLGEKNGLSVLDGITGAIARHHSANATAKTETWALDADAGAEAARVFEMLAGFPLASSAVKNAQKHGIEAILEPELPQPDDQLAWMIYTLASRALRLGDTNSFHRDQQEAN